MVLRYKSIGIGGQQWNMPFANYKYLNNKYDLSVEGFASPINSQLIRISPEKKFCSIFYDTDHWFGSLGSFFDLDISDKSICVNPPYMELIMVKTVFKILKLVVSIARCNLSLSTLSILFKSVFVKTIISLNVSYLFKTRSSYFIINLLN